MANSKYKADLKKELIRSKDFSDAVKQTKSVGSVQGLNERQISDITANSFEQARKKAWTANKYRLIGYPLAGMGIGLAVNQGRKTKKEA